jgi:hypothetical protein
LSYGSKRRAAVALGLLCGIVWLATLRALSPGGATGSVHGDGYYTWLWARSIVLDHDVDFARDYQQCGDPWELLHAPNADALNPWNPGAVIFWIPLFVYDLMEDDPALVGQRRYESACVGVLANRAVRGSVIAGMLTLVLAFLASRRITDERTAIVGSLLAMCSPVTFYATVGISQSHAASACMGGLAVFAWIRACQRATTWSWIAMGAAIGFAMLTRAQNAILTALPLSLWLEHAWPLVRDRRGRALAHHVLSGFGFVLAVLVFFGPQIAFWWDQYGEIFFLPQGRHYMRWGTPRVVNLLFSACTGLFQWHPILYLSVVGWVLMAARKETRRIGLPLLVLFGLASYVNSCVSDWWGAVGYPARRFDSLTVPFAIGLAWTLRGIGRTTWMRVSGLAPVLATVTCLFFAACTSMVAIGVGQGARLDRPGGSEVLWPAFSNNIGRPFQSAFGDPFTYPASLPFAIRYRVHPRMWRWASAPELFYHVAMTMERIGEGARYDFVDAHAPLLIGFGPVETSRAEHRVRTLMGCARALVPVFWPEIGSLRFEVTNDATDRRALWVALDDEVLGSRVVVPGDSVVSHLVTRPHDGILEMRVCASAPIGLRIMEITDIEPTPQQREFQYLTPIRERRHRWRMARYPEPE